MNELTADNRVNKLTPDPRGIPQAFCPADAAEQKEESTLALRDCIGIGSPIFQSGTRIFSDWRTGNSLATRFQRLPGGHWRE